MAYQKYNGYQYETSPRKLQPEYEPIKNPYKKKKTTTKNVNRKNTKQQVKRKLKPKARLVSYIIIGFLMLFAICYRNSLITESFNQKEKLKEEITAIKKENEQLKVNIEKSLNLNNVEQAAKEKLGMQKLDNNQKVYVNLPKKDYVESSTEEVIIEDNLNIWNKLIKGLTKSIN